MNYDIIGDIHGCAKSLVSLLGKLNYKKNYGVYGHENRQVIFLGDFVDRGPYQREVINIVRPMIDNGSARAVMGNHEYNAINYATADREGKDYLRQHNVKNDKQHQAFLNAYPFKSLDYLEIIEWFKTLPLWLDMGNFRVVHACWDQECMDRISDSILNSSIYDPTMDNDFLHASAVKGSAEFDDIEVILKGKEIKLPEGCSFKDKDGNLRHHIRTRWWDRSAKTYRDIFLGPESAKKEIPDEAIEPGLVTGYTESESPIFIGHYWIEDKEINGLSSNIACLDYSIAKSGGRLVAYRFNGESAINNDNFVWVPRQEE